MVDVGLIESHGAYCAQSKQHCAKLKYSTIWFYYMCVLCTQNMYVNNWIERGIGGEGEREQSRAEQRERERERER